MEPSTTEIFDKLFELGKPIATLTGALGLLGMAKNAISEGSLEDKETCDVNCLLHCIEAESKQIRTQLQDLRSAATP
ncbi:MAG: hypothetical protein VB050_04265 [Geobacteraceae bacterium]|nr:hypothetical protein [Geobacteraceae bacterium]